MDLHCTICKQPKPEDRFDTLVCDTCHESAILARSEMVRIKTEVKNISYAIKQAILTGKGDLVALWGAVEALHDSI